jgi:uncharacterized protein (TIGR03437 family)
MLADRNTMVSLTTSGITVLSSSYDTATAVPRIEKVVNSADGTQPVAPGGLISVFGRDLSPINVATREIPLPTALGESCLLVNGMAIPMLLASSGQINAQLPFNAEGNVTLTLRTPGGVSDNYNLTILPNAPSLFLANLDQDLQVPTIVRAANGLLVTPANPVHRGDTLIIYLTGMGKTYPDAVAGMPAPGEPALRVLTQPEVDLAGAGCPVDFAGLAPGEIGVNQINVRIPYWAPQGMSLPLRVTQGGFSTTVQVRVVD